MVSRDFVIKWTQSPKQNFTDDHRGWPKGKRRTWSKLTEKRIKKIHQILEKNRHKFFTGATAIDQKWREKFRVSPPPLRTIGKILATLHLSSKRRKDRHKGASRYLCYPEHTIYTRFGGRVLESDFIGKKYITGRTKPLNFISFSFKKKPKLKHFQRVEAQTASCFQKEMTRFIQKYEKPDFVKIDNCLAAIGSASGKRNISSTMKNLLQNQIIPIFAVPRKPFSQASIEGNNSVFSRKFWNRCKFRNLADVDKKLGWFNKAFQEYSEYQWPTAKKIRKKFVPKIYFIRQVKEDKNKKRANGYVEILNDLVYLPKAFINYFVLAKWNLNEEILYIYFEKEQKPKLIKKISFKINRKSKTNCRLSFD